ncbi:MAG: GMC family oxidoreductase N-terminal domain-containing protein [Nocardiopsaceae bacterium]|nr:GMC family oxidoreductase N-terminal domain-containing protein [Nocardiopsaceae bacterium]
MSRAEAQSRAEYDYIVIGGGSAGCALAARLAGAGDRPEVALIEAGPEGRGVSQITEPALWRSLAGTSLDWGYSYAPSPHTGNRAIGLPRGKVLGGCGAINALNWYRGHPADYDAWEEAGAQGWNHDALLPYFRRAEDWEGGETERRGAGGPMRLTQPPDPHPAAAGLLNAAAELGFKRIDDLNDSDDEGAALANLTVRDGRRHSVVDGYLAGAPASLTVLTCSTAVRLGFDGDRCEEVLHTRGGTLARTRARREVICALGAIGTPLLLLRSGIGDPADLARLGVPVRAALPGVGRNLRDHPQVAGPHFRARRRLGLRRDNGGGAVMRWRSEGADRPDLHASVIQGVTAGPEASARYGIGSAGDVFAIAPALLAPKSAGYMRVHPDGVEIQPNLLAEPDDAATLVQALDMVLDLAGTSAYRELIEAPVMPPGRLRRTEAEAFVRENCSSLSHPCGTAAMGTAPEDGAVTDPELRVFGTEGLRVADASVIPVIPRCGLQAPVIAVAERAADLITKI